MPWKIVDGQPQRARLPEVKTVVRPPEVSTSNISLYCPVCGKEYKTERGLHTHIDSH